MREIGHSTGVREGCLERAPDPLEAQFGWRPLDGSLEEHPERRVVRTLTDRLKLDVTWTGQRKNSYDLEVVDDDDYLLAEYARFIGVPPGRYEVKSLWRRSPRTAFDPRFKAGRRGETIYGRYDADVKSFAIALDECIDHVLEDSLAEPRGERLPHELSEFVGQVHCLIDDAFMRRHSRSFSERLRRIAKSSLMIPTMSHRARSVLRSTVQAADIVRGFADCQGIFLVAGTNYTLVRLHEIEKFIAVDSASSEGLKLRYTQKIPK